MCLNFVISLRIVIFCYILLLLVKKYCYVAITGKKLLVHCSLCGKKCKYIATIIYVINTKCKHIVVIGKKKN